MRANTKSSLVALNQLLKNKEGFSTVGAGMPAAIAQAGEMLWTGYGPQTGPPAPGLMHIQMDMNRAALQESPELMEVLDSADISDAAQAEAELNGVPVIDMRPMIDKMQEIMAEPILAVREQILCPQGIHQTFYGMQLLLSANPSGSRFDAVEPVIADTFERYHNRMAEIGADYEALYLGGGYDEWEAISDMMECIDAASGDATAIRNLANLAGGFAAKGHTYWLQNMRQVMPDLILPKWDAAIEATPTKENPCFSYIANTSIHNRYNRTEAALAGIANTLIPPVEWSRCVPYFNVGVTTKSTTIVQSEGESGLAGEVTDRMSIDQFFQQALKTNRPDVNNMNARTAMTPEYVIRELDSVRVENEAGEAVAQTVADYTTVIGMEVFTMPQSIVPMDQPNDAWMDRAGDASIDRSRPFMTINNFSTEVAPTTGASSTQRGTLTITLHDRARLPQIAPLIKPATLNNVEFDIEWGWSHPVNDDTNVYGQYINSLRQAGKWTLYQSSYSFTSDAQVQITLGLVMSGVDSVQELDASTTGLVSPGWQAVETAYSALDVAREGASAFLDTGHIADLSATQNINTLSLNSTGVLISADFQTELDEWIRAARRSVAQGGFPELDELIQKLVAMKTAVGNANATLQRDLDKKLSVLSSKAYKDWHIYVKTIGKMAADRAEEELWYYDGTGNDALPGRWPLSTGKYVPLGALIQLFVAQPLMTTGMYDEVQVVTYCANLAAGAASGANLGGIPVDIQKINDQKKWGDAVKEQYTKFGGQYPIVRMMEWISDNFVKPQMSPCYGLKSPNGQTGNSALQVNRESGALEPDFEQTGDLMNQTATRLLKYYYGDTTPSSELDPRPTPFTPIDLQVTFEVASPNSDELLRAGVYWGDIPEAYGNKTILRIHVYDGAMNDQPTLLDLIRQSRTSNGGVLIPPRKASAKGVPAYTREVSGWSPYSNDASFACNTLMNMGILRPVEITCTQLEGDRRTAAEAQLAGLQEQREISLALGQSVGSIDRTIAQQEALLVNGESQTSNQFFLNGGIAGAKALLRFVARMAPNIIYGEEGSQINSFTIKQKSNSRSSTTYMMRALENGGAGSDTEVNRGLPMRAAPADISLKCFGNPCYKFMQQFFINANTGTTIDNLYAVTGITHTISPDDFSTDLKLVPLEAYGVFQNLTGEVDKAQTAVEALRAANRERLARLERERQARAAAAAAAQAREDDLAARAADAADAVSFYEAEVHRINTEIAQWSDAVIECRRIWGIWLTECIGWWGGHGGTYKYDFTENQGKRTDFRNQISGARRQAQNEGYGDVWDRMVTLGWMPPYQCTWMQNNMGMNRTAIEANTWEYIGYGFFYTNKWIYAKNWMHHAPSSGEGSFNAMREAAETAARQARAAAADAAAAT